MLKLFLKKFILYISHHPIAVLNNFNKFSYICNKKPNNKKTIKKKLPTNLLFVKLLFFNLYVQYLSSVGILLLISSLKNIKKNLPTNLLFVKLLFFKVYTCNI